MTVCMVPVLHSGVTSPGSEGLERIPKPEQELEPKFGFRGRRRVDYPSVLGFLCSACGRGSTDMDISELVLLRGRAPAEKGEIHGGSVSWPMGRRRCISSFHDEY
jgi:hypothetical protein